MSRVKIGLGRLLRAVYHDSWYFFLTRGRRLSIRCGFHPQVTRLGRELGLIRRVTSPPPMAQINYDPGSGIRRAKPIIFVSACVDAGASGGWKYNGGIKELNLLVQLLRNHGYEANMVTYDGKYEAWLIRHQPHINIEELRSKLQFNKDVRCVTSWAWASAFIEECKQIYFWDMELAYSDHEHFPVLAKLYGGRIKKVAAISRTIQAWHMAQFGKPCTILPNLLDESLWSPEEICRQPFRVGFMDEGHHTQEYLRIVRDTVQAQNIELEFLLIKGSEGEVLSGMRSCGVFLAMNVGKDALWGEGCPRTLIEALATGCAVIAFDTIGNRETIQDNYNGILVPRFRPDLMARALMHLYCSPGEIERLRKNALSMIDYCHTLECRWPAVKDFLEL